MKERLEGGFDFERGAWTVRQGDGGRCMGEFTAGRERGYGGDGRLRSGIRFQKRVRSEI